MGNEGFSAQTVLKAGANLLNGGIGNAQNIADRVLNGNNGAGNGGNSNPSNPSNSGNSTMDALSIFRQMLERLKLLTPDKRYQKILINRLAVGDSAPLSNMAQNGVTYNSIIATCQNSGATLDIYLNSSSGTGCPDFQLIGGQGTQQFQFPSLSITQIYVRNTGTNVAEGSIILQQY